MQDDALFHEEGISHCKDPNGTVHTENIDATMQQDGQPPGDDITMGTSENPVMFAAPPPIPSPSASPGEYSTTEAADSGRSIPEVESVGSIPNSQPEPVQVTWNIFYVFSHHQITYL